MLRALVIGFGSIGTRHARLLEQRGVSVACVTQAHGCSFPRYPDLQAALSKHAPSLVIISNATSLHVPTLAKLAELGFQGTILIEKPLGAEDLPPDIRARAVYVAFNLRFHPVVIALRQALEGKRLISASFYAGMYLPDWRPSADYRKSYSARRAEGGGVLRDLTHELDLALWLTGGWRRVAALGGKLSELEIETDDVFSLLLECEKCPVVNIHVNYLDRVPSRRIVVNAEGLTAVADLISAQLEINGERQHWSVERDTTYNSQFDAILANESGIACTLDEALAVERLVAAAQTSAAEKRWLANQHVNKESN